MPQISPIDLKNLPLEELKIFLDHIGIPGSRAPDIFSWLYRPGFQNFGQMADIKKEIRDLLAENAKISYLDLHNHEVSKDGTISTEMLIKPGPIFPKFRKITPERQIVEGQLQGGVGIGTKTRCRNLLGCQAAANLVPALKYADAHPGILGQVHGNEQGLIPSPNDHRIKCFIGHDNLLQKSIEILFRAGAKFSRSALPTSIAPKVSLGSPRSWH